MPRTLVKAGKNLSSVLFDLATRGRRLFRTITGGTLIHTGGGYLLAFHMRHCNHSEIKLAFTSYLLLSIWFLNLGRCYLRGRHFRDLKSGKNWEYLGLLSLSLSLPYTHRLTHRACFFLPFSARATPLGKKRSLGDCTGNEGETSSDLLLRSWVIYEGLGNMGIFCKIKTGCQIR